MKYEYASLLIYVPFDHGLFYNYRTHDPLREYNGGGMPDLLQQVSNEGWRIVHMEKQEPQADNDWIVCVMLQREVIE